MLQRYRLLIGPMERQLICMHASRTSYCSCVCAAGVLEVTCCVFITTTPELTPFYVVTVVSRIKKQNKSYQNPLLAAVNDTKFIIDALTEYKISSKGRI